MQQAHDEANDLRAANVRLASERDALSARVAELEHVVEAKHQDHEAACCIIADMHRAAVGEITGPRRGVVEDVEDTNRVAQFGAIMAVCLYFGRMRSPVMWQYKKLFNDGHDSERGYYGPLVCDTEEAAMRRNIGYETRPLYAGYAPVPAVDAAIAKHKEGSGNA